MTVRGARRAARRVRRPGAAAARRCDRGRGRDGPARRRRGAGLPLGAARGRHPAPARLAARRDLTVCAAVRSRRRVPPRLRRMRRTVQVPGAKVALSTASCYPETCTTAFEMAADLGFDGVEVMVWTDPVSQDPDALRGAVRPVRRAGARDPRAVPAAHPAGVVDRPVDQAAAGAGGRRAGRAPTVVVHPPFRWQREYAREFVDGPAPDAGRDRRDASRWRTCSRGGPAAARSRPTCRTGTCSSSTTRPPRSTCRTPRSPGPTRCGWSRRWATGCRTSTWPTAPGRTRTSTWCPAAAASRAPRCWSGSPAAATRGTVVLEINTRRAVNRDEREADLAEGLAFARLNLAAAAGSTP